VFLVTGGYPDLPNFGPPPKIHGKNAPPKMLPNFRKSVNRRKNPGKFG